MPKYAIHIALFILLTMPFAAMAQLSPGELAKSHSHLEGISNCTKCHILGEKVSNEKCLACHTELKERIDQKKGYHYSSEVRGKTCVTCHSDHHGTSFQLIRFNREKFNHTLTGFTLNGAHAKQECVACHKGKNIRDQRIREKKFTYLGLDPSCLSCHTDVHRKTLSAKCTECHGQDAFVPAVNFSHARTKFPLTGRHTAVDCAKCHKITTENGQKFQSFAGVSFNTCASCHTDPHRGQFGPKCAECHTTASFHTVQGVSGKFDHSKTDFPLVGKHNAVSCSQCHTNGLNQPVKHAQCLDCHKDFHNGQFTRQGVKTDCSKCHNTNGFTQSQFTIDMHNAGNFILSGAHLATACTECHKKQGIWKFKDIGTRCISCHKDIHQSSLNTKYYPDQSCENCHITDTWKTIQFDHSATSYPLTGGHSGAGCAACHSLHKTSGTGPQFAGITQSCSDCHEDAHMGQFAGNGKTDCSRCHDAGFWNHDRFDHSKTKFPLDGQHAKVSCRSCHEVRNEGVKSFINYKLKGTKCEDCH